MAEYMTISSRYPSWREYYLSKKKEAKGFRKGFIEYDNLHVLPSSYVNDPTVFIDTVDCLEGENFLLIPAGGNKVSLVHNCFSAVVDQPGPSVFGILGIRKTSPFKKINVGNAVAHRSPPRITRSEERKEEPPR